MVIIVPILFHKFCQKIAGQAVFCYYEIMKQVTLLLGPSGSGKSTIAQLLVEQKGYQLIDGDQLDTEFFPKGGQWDKNNSDNLQKAHTKILEHTASTLLNTDKVVIDYIVFDDILEFVSKAKEKFGDSFQVKILFPAESENLKRDTERTNWHSGLEKIQIMRGRLESLKGNLDNTSFIDTTGLTPQETVDKYF